MCLRLEATGELEAIRAKVRGKADDAEPVMMPSIPVEVASRRVDQRLDEPRPAVLTAIR